MLDERMKRLIREMPKGENHIHIEGSIPARTALRLAQKKTACSCPSAPSRA